MCPFCQVVEGSTPARIVVQDERAAAFLDSTPAARGHTLVVPRVHAEHLWDISVDDAAAVMALAHRAAALLRDRLQPDGLTLRQNTGAASGQRVAHLHLHLVPRWHGDGSVGWPWPPPTPGGIDLDDVHKLLTASASSVT